MSLTSRRRGARSEALSRWGVRLVVALGSTWALESFAHAAEYYVATTGSDSNPGTLDQPFATLQKGASVAQAGDTVWIRGGTYEIVTPATSGAGISISKSGSSDENRIRFWAYPGERPVFDFSKLAISTTGYTSGIAVSGSWLHLKGFEIRNVPMNTRSNTGLAINDPAHDNIFELLDIHHNQGSGLFISHGGGGHLILNTDSHDNYDPTSSQGDGQNADGFGVHYQTAGKMTMFRGCRAWWNSDDGWDFISQEYPVLVEDSWAFGNGYIHSGTARPADGNGNGFKAGSSKTGIRHIIRSNLAWGNRAAGFYANHSSGGNDWLNNTAYNNGTQFNLLASTWDANGKRTDGVTLTGARAHKLRNNIAFPNKNTYLNGYGVDSAANTWDLNIAPRAADFVSVSDAGFMGRRQADGSLPNLEFLKLRADSALIDRGVDVGLAFAGSAPDLGAYESGAGGTNGSGGAGGAPASGGAVAEGGRNSAGRTGHGGSTYSGAGGAQASGGGTAPTVGGSSTAGGTDSGGSAGNAGDADGAVAPTPGGTSGANAGAGGSVASGGLDPTSVDTGGASPAGGAPEVTPLDPSAARGCSCGTPGNVRSLFGASGTFVVLGLAAGLRRRRRLKARAR